MTLEFSTAVVTGASAGLGAAISRQLVHRGATVVGLARGQEGLDTMHGELGDRFVPIQCDVSDEASVTTTFEAIHDAGHSVDILVNNAGVGRYGDVLDLSTDDWDRMMATNLRGIFLCTRAAIPDMKARNEARGFGGHVVNIASIAGLLGNPGLGGYNASKFGVRGFSEALMKEVRDFGIKVSCIYPGSIATDFSNRPKSTSNPMTTDDVASTVVHVLETPDNYLVSEVVMRPLRPRG